MKKDWEIKSFEDCIENVKYTTKIPSKDYKQEGAFPIVSQEEELISGYWDNESDLFSLTKPVVIFGDHTRVLKYVDFDFVLGADGVKILQPKDFLDTKFFMYFLSNANIKHLGYARHYRLLKELNVFVPPLEEQKRIVKILDEKFAQLETIKTNTQTNLQNAKDLFQSQLTKAFSNITWEKKRLGDFSEITDGDHMPPPKSPTGFPFITISNIDKDSHTINFADTFYVPETYFANLKENRKPKKGDVLYTVTGSYGIPVIVDGSVEFCFQRHIGLIRPSSEINSNYLYYWILSPEAKKIADDVATGTAQKTVSLSSLRNFEIPLPPLPEQKRIVEELDTLSEKIRQLQEIYTKQIANCEELKQSLLQKAFEGEL